MGGFAAAIGGRIWSAMDAAKNAKTETVQIIPKSQTVKPTSHMNISQ